MNKKKALDVSIICSKCKNEDEKIFEEEESIEAKNLDWKILMKQDIFCLNKQSKINWWVESTKRFVEL